MKKPHASKKKLDAPGDDDTRRETDAEGSAPEPGEREEPDADDDGADDDDADDDDADDADDDDEADDDADNDDDEADDDEADDDRDEREDGDSVEEEGRDDSEASRAAAPLGGLQLARATLLFVGAVALLDAVVNVRYPLDEPAFWYLLPSTDIAAVLLNLAIMSWLRSPVPRWMRVGIVAWLLLVRLLRFGDGIKGRYFAQRFNAYTDLGLIPDGIRFLNASRSWWELFGGGLLVLAAIAGLVFCCHLALRRIELYLSARRHIAIAAALCGVCYFVTANTKHSPRHADLFAQGFAASALPRLQENFLFLWGVRGQKSAYGQLINETETMLADLPSDLAKLHGANVYLILVESYGLTMFVWPPHIEATSKLYDVFEQELTKQGFSMATGMLASPTYGGQSWLAHATLDTGVPVHDQLDYEILSSRKPRPIATYFRRAGYRTVVVQPNSTRDWAIGDFYDFEQKYYNRQLGYRGPAFAWATMPDQFVLDFVHRKEIAQHKQPLFIQYVLVSSHAPWSALPPVVEDWNRIGDGSIYHRLPIERFPIEWPNFEHATGAYGKSIIYDFEVLLRYLRSFVDDGSLVIILGDHQPVAEVNGDSWDYRVPVHVLSRNPELVRPFVSRGYQPGMRPPDSPFSQGMETFLPSFLVDFSTERPPASP